MADWMPIETAPKDETYVLLYADPPLFPFETNVAIGFWSPEYGDWFDNEAADTSMTAFGVNPTHWQPLPPPPTGDRGP